MGNGQNKNAGHPAIKNDSFIQDKPFAIKIKRFIFAVAQSTFCIFKSLRNAAVFIQCDKGINAIGSGKFNTLLST